jgi:glutamate formiminotransferase/formiminotetrahydrofolate cyclodeaminase
MAAFGLPKATEEEKKARSAAIQAATRYATEVPFRVMQAARASLEVIEAMVEEGNPNSVTDAGVGALCARTAIQGAFMNVRINAAGLKDKVFVDRIVSDGAAILEAAIQKEKSILETVERKIAAA